MASEYDGLPFTKPGKGDSDPEPDPSDSMEGDEPPELTDDQKGMALKKALTGNDGAAICEAARQCATAY